MDWSAPVLPAAADYLIERYAEGSSLDLSQVMAVVPGRRAGRLLLELLVQQAGKRSLALVPPKIETIGRLPEQLYKPQKQFASTLIQRLAWAKSVRELPPAQLGHLLRRPPPEKDLLRWVELGDLLRMQHREMAGEGLDFAEVVRRGAGLLGLREKQRWNVLDQLQRTYLDSLHHLNMWDKQTARRIAINQGECRTPFDIVLVATVDINQTIQDMLDQVADRIVVLVHAPQSLADHFDKLGCLLPEKWQQASVALEDRQIHLVGDPAAQAAKVAEVLASYAGRYRADEITVGVPDKGLLPHLERQLHQSNVETRGALGTRLNKTRPFQLLSALGEYLANQRYGPLAALLRQADVFEWIQRQLGNNDFVAELDQYYNRHLPTRLGQWLGRAEENSLLREVHQRLDDLLAPLLAGRRSLRQWSEPILNVLAELYRQADPLSHEDPDESDTIASCQAVGDTLMALGEVPEDLALEFSAAEVIRLVLDDLQDQSAPSPVAEHAIDLLGWLELPTDMAPAMVVTSLNEGLVPSSQGADLFLPDRMRRHLNLVDNRRRYARDVYALNVLASSRSDLTLIVGRRDSLGDPMVPSRLLFSGDDDTLVRRAQRLFTEEETPRSRSDLEVNQPTSILVPRPQIQPEPLSYMRVTAFRDYLACPYRFYLRHVLRLIEVDDSADELNALDFGILVHEAAQQFSTSPLRDSNNGAEIRKFLNSSLEQASKRRFGRDHMPAVDIQIQQCQARLSALADWQAQRHDQGWRIEFTENAVPPYILEIDGQTSMEVTGRIDRIDRNIHDGRWQILDYKTSTSAKTPVQTHQDSSGEWIDLQLPLYRHLAAGLGVTGEVELGYITIPRDLTKVACHIANWTSDELAAADEQARRVAGNILNQNFWPPKQDASHLFREFAGICQDHVFDRPVDLDIGNGESGNGKSSNNNERTV